MLFVYFAFHLPLSANYIGRKDAWLQAQRSGYVRDALWSTTKLAKEVQSRRLQTRRQGEIKEWNTLHNPSEG